MMMDMKKKKLDKLKMPEKKKMDLSSLGMDDDTMGDSGDDESSESPEFEKKEQDAGMDLDGDEGGAPMDPKAQKALESMSDDDLLAEVKKRGLMKQLGDEDGEEGHDDLMSSDDHDQKMSHSGY